MMIWIYYLERRGDDENYDDAASLAHMAASTLPDGGRSFRASERSAAIG